MPSIRLNDGASSSGCHQQSLSRVVGHQLIGPLTVRGPPLDPIRTHCEQIMITSFISQPPPDETEQQQQGSNTNNQLQQLALGGSNVGEQHLTVIHHSPRRDQESVTSMNQCNGKDESSN